MDEIASAYGIGLTAKIPINSKFTELVDAGRIEDIETDVLDNLISELVK